MIIFYYTIYSEEYQEELLKDGLKECISLDRSPRYLAGDNVFLSLNCVRYETYRFATRYVLFI
jgi:hypothetical protein